MNSDDLDNSSFLPDFCNVRMVFVVVLIAELLAILLTLGLSTRLLRSASDLAHYSLFIQWIALSSVAMLCISRPYLKKLPDPAVATLSYLLILLVSLVITEIAWWLIQNSPELSFGSTDSHALFTGRSLGISAIVSALALRYFYVQHQWRRNLERESESRIQALQSRIRPHFLFNCMNIIASLTRSEPRLAEEAIEDLSDLFRVSLQDARQLVNVSEEISLCRGYLRIEEHRLGKRLMVNWDLDDLPLDARLPSLTVQPLIENAIYHGIERLPEGGYITIRGRKDPKAFTIQVINPLPEDDPTDPHSGNQLALKNIRQRVEVFFGHRGKLSSYIEGDEYCAEIVIPYPYEDIDR